MLDDRHYMRPDYQAGGGRFRFSMTITVMISLVVAFGLQQIDRGFWQSAHLGWFELSARDVLHGRIWELLTFQFIHAGLTHLAFNLIGIWFFGRYVEDRLGSSHFLRLYFLSGVAGGLLQTVLGLAIPSVFGGATLGASAGICGLLAAFCVLEPEGTILVMFIIPVKARYLLYISLGVSLFFTLVPADAGIAHAAHLGGMLFGIAYLRWGIPLLQDFADWRGSQRGHRTSKSSSGPRLNPFSTSKKKTEAPEELPPQEFISQEVDPILDKISAHGIQSLTDRERQILQAARNRMSKR